MKRRPDKEQPPATKRPAYHWYPGDWKRDFAVQSCSFGARALWREILDLMHDGDPYGHLSTAESGPLRPEQLARMVGVPSARVKKWLAELERNGVYSRTAAGVVYSRRMVRDAELNQEYHAKRSEAARHANDVRWRRYGPTEGEKLHSNEPPPNDPTRIVDGSESDQVLSESDPSALAVAFASATDPPPPARTRLLERFPHARQRAPVERFLDAIPEGGRSETGWLSQIGSWLDGLGLAGGQAATPEEIATALTDYMTSGAPDFSPLHVRSFVDRSRARRVGSAAALAARAPVVVDLGEALEAWHHVNRVSAKFPVQHMPPDVVPSLSAPTRIALRAVGGFKGLQSMETRDEPFRRREFLSAYNAALARPPTTTAETAQYPDSHPPLGANP